MLDEERATLPPEDLKRLHSSMELQSTLLGGLYNETRRRPTPFDADLTGPGIACVPRDRAGVVRWIHNPTANNLTVTLCVGSDAAPPRFNRVMPAGESLFVYLRFASGLICVSGAGAVIGGEFDA